MRTIDVINRSLSFKLSLLLVLTVLGGALISSLILYLYSADALGETYSQRLATLSMYRQVVIGSSIVIYAVFGIVAFAAVTLFSVYYSHKVAGPLVRIRRFAGDMARFNFGGEVKFRSGDAIQPLAESASAFSRKYGELYSGLNRLSLELYSTVNELKRSCDAEDSSRIPPLVRKATAQASELGRMLSEIKL